METQEDLLSFLDLLDLDEEVIDAPLRYLMRKSTCSIKNLKSAIQLLHYKILINSQEGIECENDAEFDYVVNILKDVNTENIAYVCKIIDIVLCLNTTNIVSKAEHLLQQILSTIEFRSETPTTRTADNDMQVKTLLILTASDSILNAIIKIREKVSLLFLETPLEKILDSADENLKVFFLTKTVPRLLEGAVGYNILDRIWIFIQYFKGERKEIALKVLSCLSDYYLPTPDANGDCKFESTIIFQYNFWDIILFGLTSENAAIRKISVYLAKRAIDCAVITKKDISAKSKNHTIFEWRSHNSKALKSMWDSFFVLIDSLEEKQGNIVLPSLKLFECISIGDCWLSVAFNMGLKHDNTQVRIKCIEYKLKSKVVNQSEAQILLEALNDINIYDQNSVFEILKTATIELLKDHHSFLEIFKTLPCVKWTPVPFYHLTNIVANIRINLSTKLGTKDVSKIIIDILKIPCNNVVIRRAIHINIAYFVENCCDQLDWKDMANIYYVIHLEDFLQELNIENPFATLVKQISLKDEDKAIYLKTMAENFINIDLIILYLHNHEEDVNLFIEIINEKINKLQEAVKRQYSDKKGYLNDVIFLIHFLSKTKEKDSLLHIINELISRENKNILQYILSLFSSDANLTIEDAIALFEKHNFKIVQEGGEVLLQLYKTSVLCLNDNPELDKALLSIFTMKMLLTNSVMLNNYSNEMLNLNSFVNLVSNFKFQDAQNESVGRTKNVLYEKSCEIIYILIKEDNDVDSCINEVIQFIENVLQCGGYGCLKWILKIVNKIIKLLIKDETNLNMTQFINRLWNEIEELKSNNQYSPCIEEFVEVITHDALLKKSMYNNIVISYCNKIIEYGPVKPNPLYYLIKRLNSKDVKDYGHLIYVLCEILLYCPVPRKDQRIADNATLEVLQNPKYGINKDRIDVHFNYEIQYLSIATLCSINDIETVRMVINFITIRIDNIFKNKLRYHGNSQLHRVLQITLQHLLILVMKSDDLESTFRWCIDLLVKLPHQPSVRICFEWFGALYFYIKKISLGKEMLQILKSNNVPVTSQFYIVYWLLKHKIKNNTYTEIEYDYVMDFLLSHTMGQLFNVRLNAQYLATQLYKLATKSKYQYTIDIIDKTFTESSSDKMLAKIRSDYFINDFDIIANLSPYFVYYMLPRYCDADTNEKVDTDFIKTIMKDINESISRGTADNDFIKEWKTCRKADEEFMDIDVNKCVASKLVEDSESVGTIQKKYVPWKNMSDINVYDVGKKRESKSELIVVASLIDKLPNLGGLARTSEVFGVRSYVLDSLRHLQDKQFQGLSVSAERWIDVEEVRPGRPLKEYLMKKKEEGYSVVAAEQTSTSTKLQTFKFPKKTVLLLGHEKEGVPCDLLPIMDHCVEIPQQGYVRSLNVHVTAAIFVWEYARQNVL